MYRSPVLDADSVVGVLVLYMSLLQRLQGVRGYIIIERWGWDCSQFFFAYVNIINSAEIKISFRWLEIDLFVVFCIQHVYYVVECCPL